MWRWCTWVSACLVIRVMFMSPEDRKTQGTYLHLPSMFCHSKLSVTGRLDGQRKYCMVYESSVSVVVITAFNETSSAILH